MNERRLWRVVLWDEVTGQHRLAVDVDAPHFDILPEGALQFSRLTGDSRTRVEVEPVRVFAPGAWHDFSLVRTEET